MEEQTSGTSRAWLLWAIKEQCAGGQELIAESNAIGRSKRYKWLLGRLEERLEVEIIQGYHKRRRAEANEASWELRRRNLATIEENLASRRESRQKVGLGDDSYSLNTQKVADKLRKAIEKHELQEGAKEHGTE